MICNFAEGKNYSLMPIFTQNLPKKYSFMSIDWYGFMLDLCTTASINSNF
jgi:hypothetical protein